MSFITLQKKAAHSALKYPLITETSSSGYRRNRSQRLKVLLGHPDHLPASASWMVLTFAVVTALVQREPKYLAPRCHLLIPPFFVSKLGVHSHRQISFSFMSMSHQKRKTQSAGGMTPPLLLDDPAHFQQILRVCAPKSCSGDDGRSCLGVESAHLHLSTI